MTIREEDLIPLLTDEFLHTLAEAGRVSGWNNDYTEIDQFIRDMHDLAEKEIPGLEPYPEEDEV